MKRHLWYTLAAMLSAALVAGAIVFSMVWYTGAAWGLVFFLGFFLLFVVPLSLAVYLHTCPLPVCPRCGSSNVTRKEGGLSGKSIAFPSAKCADCSYPWVALPMPVLVLLTVYVSVLLAGAFITFFFGAPGRASDFLCLFVIAGVLITVLIRLFRIIRAQRRSRNQQGQS